ncbi:hypothetical protein [Streptomyces omiyaensis]|uniref:hypothetical protein n=1 Tax=Streptomyces omiyaensis TaxID=68247 RepID=UPI001678C5B6|nr:hypothetical protein [Streptomyces omiyaensis]GGY63494.1 hypothetical protein GCM10010363_51220 [Streptomyces omiyaensis]
MRRIALSAASVLVGALAVCLTALHAPQASAAQEQAVASQPPAVVVAAPLDNHGND